MADSTIFDLTAETVLTAAHEFVTQDTSAATRAQAATFALMGGLAYSASSVTTANVTATVGTLHGLDLSGLTADRDFVLPDSAQVGERVGVFVTVGDASFELDLVTAATGSQINGANAGGGTSWSRLFITNEVVIFRCINAGGAGDTDWIVEHDGRIPCKAQVVLSTSTAVTADTWTDLNIGASDDEFDVGDVYDATLNSNNGGFRLRRAASVLIGGNLDQAGALTAGEYFGVSLKTNGTQEAGSKRLLMSAGDTQIHRMPFGLIRNAASGDNFGFMVATSMPTPPNFSGVFYITEVL